MMVRRICALSAQATTPAHVHARPVRPLAAVTRPCAGILLGAALAAALQPGVAAAQEDDGWLLRWWPFSAHAHDAADGVEAAVQPALVTKVSAAAEAPEHFVEPETGLEFVHVPGGCFEMGGLDVGVVGEVCLTPFYIGRFEVTNRQFRAFRPEHDSGTLNGFTLDDEHQPVVGVTWQDAVDFADWLSERTGRSFRLPTEAEWEYAARAGTTTARFWGADAADAATFANLKDAAEDGGTADGFPLSAPVGSFPANPLGLHDVLGNASEWVLDGYLPGAERYGATLRDPVVDPDGLLRVRRGGSWDDPPSLVRAAARDYYVGRFGLPQTGFRLALDVEPQENAQHAKRD